MIGNLYPEARSVALCPQIKRPRSFEEGPGQVLVKVRFAGLFRHYTGVRERVFDVPEGYCASDLLRLIGNEYGCRLPSSLWDPQEGSFHRTIRLARIGSGPLNHSDPLTDGDELLVLFTLAGG